MRTLNQSSSRRERAVSGQLIESEDSSESGRPAYSIVIPAYNEESRIGRTLERICAYLSALGSASEIIVVDDGSNDGTAALVQARITDVPPNVSLRLLQHFPNRGKGASVKEGCLAALGDYVLFSDADLATPIEEADKLWAALKQGHDIAIGSRVHPDGRDMRSTQPAYRRLFGKLYRLIVGILILRGIKDTQCGFKAFTRPSARFLMGTQQISGIVFDTELLFLARLAGLRIAQLPVLWTNIGGSRMRVTPGQAFAVLRDLCSIRWRHRKTPAFLRANANDPSAS